MSEYYSCQGKCYFSSLSMLGPIRRTCPVCLGDKMQPFKAEIDRLRQRVKTLEGALQPLVEWMASEDGPIYDLWEEGEICNWDNKDTTWLEALAGVNDEVMYPMLDDLRTGFYDCLAVGLYRQARQALSQGRGGETCEAVGD